MNTALATNRVLEQLENAMDSGHVPAGEKRRAAQLLSRLKSPVQIVLIGRKGVGKSRLINMLAGQSVVPGVADLPPLEVAFGRQERTVFFAADGSERTQEGLHLDQPVPGDTAILRVELPLPALAQLTLTELTLSGSMDDQKAIVGWAMNRADIVLWCSQSFDPSEQALWSPASDTLKDHSFLVLTKADQLQMKGLLSSRISDLEDVVAEEFFRMYPVATIQAISSFGSGGRRDKETWASSGGGALVDAIGRLVEAGQSAAADNAVMFLNHHTANRARAAAQARAEPDANPNNAKGNAKTAEKRSQTDKRTNSPIPAGTGQLIRQAIEFLEKRAGAMLRVASEDSPDKEAFVLDHCLETANQLTEIMMDAEQTDPSLLDIQEDVMDCSDMMVLFHLEKTKDAAADAVTLLLQIKKEMSVAAAP